MNGEESMRRKALITIILMLLVIFALAACGESSATAPNTGTVTFCESVDKDGVPVNEGTEFKAGEVYIHFETENPFNVIKIHQTIYRIEGGSEEICYEQNIRVKRNWFMLWGNREFSEPGKYRVEYTRLTNSGMVPMGEGHVTIF